MANKLGALIKEYRKSHDLSLRDFGKVAGLSHTHVSSIENGIDPRTGKEVRVSNDTIEKLANAMSLENSYLLNLSLGIDDIGSVAEAKSYKIPVFGQIAAGNPIFANDEIVDYEEVPRSWKNKGEFFAVRLKGDSMLPRFSDGDVVIVRKQDSVDSGDLAIVLVNGDEATFKKVELLDNGIVLIALNSAVYTPKVYTNDDIERLPVRIIGKVVEARIKL